MKSRANQPSSTAAAVRRTAVTRARSISSPVAAPPAWTTRGIEWPPSRASWRPPPSSVSNTAPRAMSSWTRAGALVDEHAHGVGVTQPDAGGQRVGQMEVGGVLVSERAPRPRRPEPTGSPTGTARPWTAPRCAGPPGAGWPPPAPRPRGRRRRCRGSGGPDRGWSARSGCHRVVSSATARHRRGPNATGRVGDRRPGRREDGCRRRHGRWPGRSRPTRSSRSRRR